MNECIEKAEMAIADVMERVFKAEIEGINKE